MTEKEIVCRVADRTFTIVVLDDDKELVPMKSAVAYRKSLSYDKDQGEDVVRFSRIGKADMVDKRRGRCLRWLVRRSQAHFLRSHSHSTIVSKKRSFFRTKKLRENEKKKKRKKILTYRDIPNQLDFLSFSFPIQSTFKIQDTVSTLPIPELTLTGTIFELTTGAVRDLCSSR